jgi:hypothetical protein
MVRYPNGKAVVSDARLRISALPHDVGILIVEGGTDKRIFTERRVPEALILVAGGKPNLLEAHALLRDEEQRQLVFVADCDHDVPCGLLRPKENLVLSASADMESDLVELGVFRRVVLHLIPSASESDAALDRVTADILTKARSLATSIGRLRRVARREALALDFENLNFPRLRAKHGTGASLARVVEVVASRSRVPRSDWDRLEQAARDETDDSSICCGHDLLGIAADVLRRDYGVAREKAGAVEEMVRVAVDNEVFDAWEVARRLRMWQQTTGRRVLVR